MPQHVEQSQIYCEHCQQHTLHQKIVVETNHILHLLLTLLCFGLWIFIWILAAVATASQQGPFRCLTCGQRADRPVSDDLSWDQLPNCERENLEAMEAENSHVFLERCYEAFELATELCAAGAVAVGKELKILPKKTDRVLRNLAGEGNDIVFWFLRITVVAIALFMVAAGLAVFLGGCSS